MKPLFLIPIALATGAPCSAQGQQLTRDQAWQIALAYWNGFQRPASTSPKSCGGVECLEFRGNSHDIMVDSGSGALVRFWSNDETGKGAALSTSALRSLVNQFINSQPNATELRDLKFVESLPVNHGYQTGLSFEFAQFEGEVRLPHSFTITLDSVSGKLQEYNYSNWKVVRPWKASALTKDQAVNAAMAGAKKTTRLQDLTLASALFNVGPYMEKEGVNFTYWDVNLTGYLVKDDGSIEIKKGWSGWVNPDNGSAKGFTGETIGEPIRLKLRTGPRGTGTVNMRAYWSTTDDSPIYFSTFRAIKNSAGKLAQAAVPARLEKDGTITVLAVPDGRGWYSAVTLDQKKLAIWLYDQIWILELDTGRLGRLNNPERTSRDQPSWDQTGIELATTGFGNIYLSGLAPELGPFAMRDNYRPAAVDGLANSPTISPDGKWLAFSMAKDPPSKPGQPDLPLRWSLYVVALHPYSANAVPAAPIMVCKDIPSVLRISWFPDSRHMVVSYLGDYEAKYRPMEAHPADLIDRVTAQRKLLPLPVLHDPFMTKSKPLSPAQIAVSPSGKKLLFEAALWSGSIDDDTSQCLYECNLDGSGLKRLTPPHVVPLVPYQFPVPGLNALNIWSKRAPAITDGD